MRKMLFAFIAVLMVPALLAADPVSGVFYSTDNGGQMLTGRYSNWRSRTNLPNGPRVLNIQSWDGAALGTQWTLSCAVDPAAAVTVDNRVDGVGTIVYTGTHSGGTFEFYAGGYPWGFGAGTLGVTTIVTTEYYELVSGTSTLVSSTVTGNTYGSFLIGECTLEFSWATGAQIGKSPYQSKPATYPAYLNATCGIPTQNYGEYGDLLMITCRIHCPISADESTWGAIKELYR